MNIILFDELNKDNILFLNDDRGKHIVNILKLKCGDSFKCGVINSHSGVGTIKSIDSEKITFTYFIEKDNPLLPIPLTIIVGAIRPICLKRVIRAASECGVNRIIISGTDLGEKSYLNSSYIKDKEIYKTLLDGAIQSGTTFVPTLSFSNMLDTALSEFAKKDDINKIVFDNKTEFYKSNITSFKPSNITKSESVVVIGSERGFTDRERDVIRKANFIPYKLGNRILRTETAFITSLYPFIIQN